MCDHSSCIIAQELKRVKKECDGLYADLKKAQSACYINSRSIRCRSEREGKEGGNASKLSQQLHKEKKGDEETQLEIEKLKSEIVVLKEEVKAKNRTISDLSGAVQNAKQNEEKFQIEYDKLKTENAFLKLNTEKNMEIFVDHWKQKCEYVERENAKLNKKLCILQRGAEIYQSVGHYNDKDDQQNLKNTYSRFKARPLSQEAKVQECTRCHQIFTDDDSADNTLCEYHDFPPWDYNKWSRSLPHEMVENLVAAGKMNCKYWICCDKLQKRKPRGCKYALHKL